MDRSKIESIFRWRKTLVDNFDKIKSAKASSKKADLSSQGQLSMFDAGLEDVKEMPKLEEYSGAIHIMDWVRSEMSIVGTPYTYNSLDDLSMYKDLYCTNEVVDLFELTEDKSKIVVMDWITEITHHKSKDKGSPYVKIYTSLYGADNYWFLWGKDYQSLIAKVYINEIYLFELNYRIPTKNYSKESINITHLNNIKDIDVNGEYERVYNLCKVNNINKKWIETNKPEWL